MKTTTKLLLATFILVLLNANSSKAQTAYEKGKSYGSLGYAYQVVNIKALFKTYNGADGFTVSGMGPIRLNYEYAISDKVGIGFNAGYTTASVNWVDNTFKDSAGNNYNYKYKYSKTTLLARLNFHLAPSEKIDPYVGFGIGYKKTSYSFTTNDPLFTGISFKGIPMGLDATFGCRFLFSPSLGGYVELGAGHGFLQGGLCAKF